MIVLNTGTTNNVSLSLSDSVTISDPYYTFRFIDDDNNEKVFYAEDVALNSRTQDFVITLTGGTENLTGSTISWNYNEKGRYFIYQADASGVTSMTSANLKPIYPSATFNKDVDWIETGFVWVNVADEIPVTEYTASDTNTTVVYRG